MEACAVSCWELMVGGWHTARVERHKSQEGLWMLLGMGSLPVQEKQDSVKGTHEQE